MAGTLYVVATPIGNLEDLTFRALRVLGEVDLIAAEDTRRTSRLLAHYRISKPLTSLREHNEARASARIVDELAAGRSVAVVSDAGTPGISDPGARLVHATREAGLPVVVIPGASAVAAAVSVSGFETNQFVFMGFPPVSGSQRLSWFTQLAQDPRMAVMFEAPHRVQRTISDLAALVKRPILIARELTKIHETLVISPIVGPPVVKAKGEFTIVVAPKASQDDLKPSQEAVFSLFERLTTGVAFSPEAALPVVAKLLDVDEPFARKMVKKATILVKQQNRRSP